MAFHWIFYLSIPLAVGYFFYPFYILKAAPVWACAIASYLQGHRYGRTIALGLVFGSAGDILLDMKDNYGIDLFIPGLVAFLIGHLCYIRAFYRPVRPLNEARWIGLIVALCYYGPVMGVLLSQVSYLMIAPIAIYGAVITAMVFFAWNRYCLSKQFPLWTRRLCLAGALFFVASDTLLSFNAFYSHYEGAGLVVMITYYLGQMLVSASSQCELDLNPIDVDGVLMEDAEQDFTYAGFIGGEKQNARPASQKFLLHA